MGPACKQLDGKMGEHTKKQQYMTVLKPDHSSPAQWISMELKWNWTVLPEPTPGPLARTPGGPAPHPPPPKGVIQKARICHVCKHLDGNMGQHRKNSNTWKYRLPSGQTWLIHNNKKRKRANASAWGVRGLQDPSGTSKNDNTARTQTTPPRTTTSGPFNSPSAMFHRSFHFKQIEFCCLISNFKQALFSNAPLKIQIKKWSQ